MHSHLVLTLRISRYIPLLPLCKCIAFYRETFTFTIELRIVFTDKIVLSVGPISKVTKIKDVDNFPG